ncbi:MAG: divergent polysaccharide deacetylase family protein [Candidatus Latescibacterota bacterium]|nr:MAG: divergent polysaccharide deacetylase family protein [Candidatus Latescibacterota bacterium]
MARRAAKRRRRRMRPGFLLAATIVALLAVAAIYTWTSRSGQAFLVRTGLTDRFLDDLTLHLDVALAERFLEMGLLGSDLRARRVLAGETEVREYRFQAPSHLTPTQCNLRITRAGLAAGALVVRAEENHRRGGEVVVWLGFGPHVTHRVVVQPAPPKPAPTTEPAPRIALIIDDLGHNMNATTRAVFDLGIPLTVAVLPDLPNSEAAFRLAAERGVPAILHLPMEPEGRLDPGRQPVTVGMGETEIEALLERHQTRYPTFIGVNNHMGSRATADRSTMRALASVLKRRDLFFIDSQTTPNSVGYEAARQCGLWTIRNDLFLDSETRSAETVALNLMELCDVARQTGLAVGIAHPRPYTVQALRALLPRLQAEGFEFVTLVVLRDGDAHDTARRS